MLDNLYKVCIILKILNEARSHMKPESYELFKNESIESIVTVIETELKTRNESPFWADKVVPFSEAI